MKVLVYGAGVIGCYLAHVLREGGNDVTLLARGGWKETLERDGLVIRHHLQRKTTTDHPRIVGGLDPAEPYDAVFAVMQYGQMWGVLDDLARANSPLVVLVGNNMACAEMAKVIQEKTAAPKTVLFSFQGTGGRREDGKVVCVHLGTGDMSIGGALSEAPEEVKAALNGAFRGTKYVLNWIPNMDAWCKCHLAFILPVAYLSYTLDCDLTRATGRQMTEALNACAEGYDLLTALGCPILPPDSREKLRGVKFRMNHAVMMVMAKTTIGRLAATDHCRHAVSEMEAFDAAWDRMRAAKPDFPMPQWDALRSATPAWEELRERYKA